VSRARQIVKLANGNIPYHGSHAEFIDRGWPGGEESGFSVFCEFESSLVWEFELFWECNDFGVLQSLLRDWL